MPDGANGSLFFFSINEIINNYSEPKPPVDGFDGDCRFHAIGSELGGPIPGTFASVYRKHGITISGKFHTQYVNQLRGRG